MFLLFTNIFFHAVLNKSWKQQPPKLQLSHLTIHPVWWYWRNEDELISDNLLWTPTHGNTSVGQPAKTYIYQLCKDTRCCLEHLPGAKDDRDGWWASKDSILLTQLNDDMKIHIITDLHIEHLKKIHELIQK